MDEPVPARQLAGRREWTALAVLALPLLLVSMDVSVLYFAVPFISADLAPSAAQQLWIFDIYGFVLAGLLLTMGALGDRIGRRRLLLIGAFAFSAASLLAAYSGSAEMLVLARALQGVAGATLMPSTLALIRNMFHDEAQRGKAIAIWTAVTTGGIALGPVLSGILLEHFWWGSVFLINIPAMVLLLLLGPVLLPEFRAANPGRFDIISAVLSLATVLPIIYGIKEWAADGFDVRYVAFIVGGVLAGVAFVVRQRRLTDPMLDLELLGRRGFGGSVAMNLIAMFALVGNSVFATQYLQLVLGLSPLVAALWSVVPSVVVAGMAPLATVLGGRINRAVVMAGGFAVAAAGFVVLVFLRASSPLILVLVGAALLAAGLVMVMTLVTEIAMGAVDPERAGAASAVMETSSEFGGALGIALLGSLGAAIYTGRMVGHLPAGVPAHLAGEVTSTLGGATASSAHLPEGLAGTVLATARDAFTVGYNWVAVAAACLMVAAAIGCAAVLRRSVPDRVSGSVLDWAPAQQ